MKKVFIIPNLFIKTRYESIPIIILLFMLTVNLQAGIGVGESQDAPTPVELTMFSASLNNNDAVLLNWTTATEVNNYGFEIQRLAPNVQPSEFETIGFVEGSGNSNSPKEYSYVDNSIESAKYVYRLKQIDMDGSYKYSNEIEVTVGGSEKFKLMQNYPNPYNPTTVISYSIPKTSQVTLKVYDVLGNEITTLVNEVQDKGTYKVRFDASNLSAGVYFYRINAGEYTSIRKMLLLK